MTMQTKRCTNNCDEINARRRARRAKDPEKYRAQERARGIKNREKINAQKRARLAKDPEKRKAQRKARSRARRAKDPEKVNAQQRACRIKKPEKYRAKNRKGYHKRKGGMIVFELMIAANIIKREFMKGTDDGNKSINNPKRKPV